MVMLPPFLHFPESSIHDKTMGSDSYSFKTALMPTRPQMSNDECLLPHSGPEVAGQWSRKPDTLLNEMVKRRGFLCHVHTHKLWEWWGQRSLGIAGL